MLNVNVFRQRNHVGAYSQPVCVQHAGLSLVQDRLGRDRFVGPGTASEESGDDRRGLAGW